MSHIPIPRLIETELNFAKLLDWNLNIHLDNYTRWIDRLHLLAKCNYLTPTAASVLPINSIDKISNTTGISHSNRHTYLNSQPTSQSQPNPPRKLEIFSHSQSSLSSPTVQRIRTHTLPHPYRRSTSASPDTLTHFKPRMTDVGGTGLFTDGTEELRWSGSTAGREEKYGGERTTTVLEGCNG